MNVMVIIHGLGSTGLFASRAFLPAFLTALLLRFGPEITVLDVQVFASVEGAPTWFTHDITLIVLGILSAIEMFAYKTPEGREFLLNIDKYIKTGSFGLAQIGVINVADAKFAENALQQPGPVNVIAVLTFLTLVFGTSYLRSQVMKPFIEADEDDDLRLQGLFSWIEDLWVVIGVLVLFVFPFLMVLAIVGVVGVMFVIRKRLEYREKMSRVPCDQCGTSIYPSAIACSNCLAATKSQKQIGFLGTPLDDPVTNLRVHSYKLVEKKRCPICAERLQKAIPTQECQSCGHRLMSNQRYLDGYFEYVERKVPKVGAIVFGLGMIPLLGMVVSFVYYRTEIVAPFRRYIPRRKRLLTKWLMRFFRYIMFVFQIIPFLGGVIVLILALTEYFSYRRVYRSLFLFGPGSKRFP